MRGARKDQARLRRALQVIPVVLAVVLGGCATDPDSPAPAEQSPVARIQHLAGHPDEIDRASLTLRYLPEGDRPTLTVELEVIPGRMGTFARGVLGEDRGSTWIPEPRAREMLAQFLQILNNHHWFAGRDDLPAERPGAEGGQRVATYHVRISITDTSAETHEIERRVSEYEPTETYRWDQSRGFHSALETAKRIEIELE